MTPIATLPYVIEILEEEAAAATAAETAALERARAAIASYEAAARAAAAAQGAHMANADELADAEKEKHSAIIAHQAKCSRYDDDKANVSRARWRANFAKTENQYELAMADIAELEPLYQESKRAMFASAERVRKARALVESLTAALDESRRVWFAAADKRDELEAAERQARYDYAYLSLAVYARKSEANNG